MSSRYAKKEEESEEIFFSPFHLFNSFVRIRYLWDSHGKHSDHRRDIEKACFIVFASGSKGCSSLISSSTASLRVILLSSRKLCILYFINKPENKGQKLPFTQNNSSRLKALHWV